MDTAFGLRWLDWPKIVEPGKGAHASSSEGKLLHDGEVPRTPENNGLSKILHRGNGAGVISAPMGISVYQTEKSSTDEALLAVELRLQEHASARGDSQVLFEIQNEAGTVFFYQNRVRVAAFAGYDGRVRHPFREFENERIEKVIA